MQNADRYWFPAKRYGWGWGLPVTWQGWLKWYQSLHGLPETVPAHDYFGQVPDADGTVLLCLHA